VGAERQIVRSRKNREKGRVLRGLENRRSTKKRKSERQTLARRLERKKEESLQWIESGSRQRVE